MKQTISILALASLISLPALAESTITRIDSSRTYQGNIAPQLKASSPGPITDRAIKKTLHDLYDDHDEVDHVKYSVRDNVVILEGDVDNLREKLLAVELASQVNGVHHIVDKVKTKSSEVLSPYGDETKIVNERYSSTTISK